MLSRNYEVTQAGQKFDYVLLILIITLVVLGIFVVFSASVYISGTFFLFRQLTYAVIGFVALYFGMRIDFFHLRKIIKPLILGEAILLFCTYFNFLGGSVVNGAGAWIKFPFINLGFEPAEFAKIISIIYISSVLSNPEYQKTNLKQKILLFLPIISICGLVLFEPALGNTAIISLAVFSIYFVSGLPISRVIGAGLLGLIGVAGTILHNPYQLERIEGLLDPWKDPQGKGYQLVQSLMAIGSGGISGRGLGQSIQKLHYLPECHTDFIFAIYCEETGLIGSLMFLFLIFVLATRGFSIAVKSKDKFIKFLATGITTQICGQAVLNIGVTTVILPTTGITLPFISFGGTSLITNLFCIGLLLNASMYTSSNWKVIEGNKES